MHTYLCYALPIRIGYARREVVALRLDKPEDIDAASPQAIKPRQVVAENRDAALATYARLEPDAAINRARERYVPEVYQPDPDVRNWGDADDILREMYRGTGI